MDTKETDFFNLDEEAFDTIIGSDINFLGTIRFVKPFMIRGKVKGKINATSDLVVDTNAFVNADIKAKRVLVRGQVNGNINVEQLVFVTQTGSLTGDITAEQVVLEPGSMFSGRCTMVKNNA